MISLDSIRALMTAMGNIEKRVQDVESRESGAGMLWQDFTPTVAQGVGLTITVTVARWARIGKTVFVEGVLLITSTGTSGQRITVTLPNSLPSKKSVSNWLPAGTFIYQDISAGFYAGQSFFAGSRAIWFMRDRDISTDFIGIDPTFAAVNTDSLSFQLCYECG